MLVFTTTGAAGPLAERFLQRLAGKLTEKDNSKYSVTMAWLRCRLSFALLRGAILEFAEVGPTASILSTPNESWPLCRAEWRFTNSLHAACRTFFSWFPFPSFSFPHSDLYLHVLLDSYIGVIFSTYRYALTS